ncbi:MAG: YggS family pyridoxal phosphate-dependent enzyme [Stappiaceae bacterium]
MTPAERLGKVKKQLVEATAASALSVTSPTLIAVSKTYDADTIEPVIEAGQRVFGENRVQESQGKWPALQEKYPDLELHLIGPLQSNKAADAVALFDVIQTVDREKIARALKKEMDRQKRSIQLFVQVNTGSEPQKGGVLPADADQLIAYCRDDQKLEIAGLMCIPPAGEDPVPHFTMLADIARRNDICSLSMGMSADFERAAQAGATHIRVGSAIFGPRLP